MSAPEMRGPRSRRWWLASGLALLVVVGVLAWLVVRVPGGGDEQPGPAAASGSTAAPAPAAVTEVPLPTAAPTAVPHTVLADAPQLPPNLPAVALAEPSTFGNGVQARLVTIGTFDAQAHGPGELSGPALAVVVELSNGTGAAIPLETVGVNLYYGADGTPAVRLRDGATAPLRGELAAGKSVQATYAFSVPADGRDVVTVAVSFAAGDGTALFSGPIS